MLMKQESPLLTVGPTRCWAHVDREENLNLNRGICPGVVKFSGNCSPIIIFFSVEIESP